MEAWQVQLGKIYRVKRKTGSGKERIVRVKITRIIDPGFWGELPNGETIRVPTKDIIEPLEENET